MNRAILRWAPLACYVLLSWTTHVHAQYPGNVVRYGYTSPTVSPYVNLGINPNGLSNYQTLVKPMLEEREALARQSAGITRLQQQTLDLRKNPAAPDAKEKDAKARSATSHFMYHSHFFGSSPQ